MSTTPRTMRQHDDPTAPVWMLDAGHGWLAVSLHTYPDALDHASTYSYRRGDVVALEEDADAPRWLAAHPDLDVEEHAGAWTVLDWSMTPSGDAPCRSWTRCGFGAKVPALI